MKKKTRAAATTADRAGSIETLLAAAVGLLGELIKALTPAIQKRRAPRSTDTEARGSSTRTAKSSKSG
jgi:hypothetical protein